MLRQARCFFRAGMLATLLSPVVCARSNSSVAVYTAMDLDCRGALVPGIKYGPHLCFAHLGSPTPKRCERNCLYVRF